MPLRLALLLGLVLGGCRGEDSPSGVYVNNDSPGDTLHLRADGSVLRTARVEGRRVSDPGTWELDENGHSIWIDGLRYRGGGLPPPPEFRDRSGLSGLTIERDWRGRYDRILYSADEYAAFVRVR